MNDITNTASTTSTGDSIAANLNSRRNRRLALATALTAGAVAIGVGGSSASAIVAGEATTTADNPWQVSLQSDGEHFCGGSLVSDRIVVTAAHCTEGTDAAAITIRAGASDLSTDQGQTRQVTQVNEQQKYINGVGDIALLVLDKPFDASPNISTIKIATAAESTAATTGRVTGWGVTSEEAEGTPSVLQTADVPMVADADCALVETGNDDELCAGGTGTDSCYGDSGGPLTIESARGRVLAGVVSWGSECGGEDAGVYTEVQNFTDWIEARIANPDAPQEDRLPAQSQSDGDDEVGDAGSDDDDFSDDDFGDAGSDDETIWIDQEFFDQYEGSTDFDNMSDEEFDAFFQAYDEWTEQNGSGVDVGIGTAGDSGSGESDDAPEDGDFDSTEFDTNGDGVVQWSELETLFA